MAIWKILLPLQLATTATATFSTAVMVARLWRAHLAVCTRLRAEIGNMPHATWSRG